MAGTDYPQFGPHVDPSIRKAFTDAFRRLNELAVRIGATENVTSAPVPSVPQIRKALSATGAYPLNLQGLLGVAAQAQIAGIPTVTALPGPNDPITQHTGVVRYAGTLWIYDATTEPGSWNQLSATNVVEYGALIARPSITTADNGRLYYALDQFALYIAVGGSWFLMSGMLCDIYSNRPTVSAADNGKYFFATDQSVLYVVIGGLWTYLSGTMYDVASNLPTLQACDAGFLYHETDTTDVMRWTGSSWVRVSSSRIEVYVRSESGARGSPVSSHPTMRDGEFMFEINTDDSNKLYLWHRKSLSYIYFIMDGSI